MRNKKPCTFNTLIYDQHSKPVNMIAINLGLKRHVRSLL